MINWKGCERKRSWPNLRHCPGICLDGLRKTTKNLGQDSRSPGPDLNLGPPEYEAGVLTLDHDVSSLASVKAKSKAPVSSFGISDPCPLSGRDFPFLGH
jgi:hypothetical protein